MQSSNDRERRGVEGHRISEDTRPGAGFESADFVKESCRGATVERLFQRKKKTVTVDPGSFLEVFEGATGFRKNVLSCYL